MRRLLIVLGLLAFAGPDAYAFRPERTPLRWKAQRGNAGKRPPRGAEWPSFNGQLSEADHAALLRPAHKLPVPLAGLLPAGAHPATALTGSSLAALLKARGIKPAIASRAAAHAMLGLPSGANRESSEDYLVAMNDSVRSYSSSRKTLNWISYTITDEHLAPPGQKLRSDDTWRVNPSLPRNFGVTTFRDYLHAGFDPGHMLASGDRTASLRANQRTYLTDNTVMQSFNVNRGPWLTLENYARAQVRWGGKQAHVLAGPIFGAQPFMKNGVPVPNATWKIVVLLDKGQTMKDVNEHTPIVSVIMPNDDAAASVKDTYEKFVTSPAEIERQTGLKFFRSLPAPLANALRKRAEAGPPAPGPPSTPPPWVK